MSTENGLKSSPFKVVLVAFAAAGAFLVFSQFLSNRSNTVEKIHTLKQPLLFTSEDNAGYHLIPAGTTLYYEHSMPEGFSTYRIYINIEGVDLPLEENKPFGAIKPASALSIDKNQLMSLLKDVQLKYSDLEKILDNGNFSSAEKEEVLKSLKAKNSPP